MFVPKGLTEKKDSGGPNKNGFVGVAIDKDKGSQYALKWAIDNLLERGQTVVLIHVKLNQNPPSSPSSPRRNQNSNANEDYRSRGDDLQTKELFLPFRCFCTRKDIQCKEVVIEDLDVAKGLAECVNQAAIEHLVIGASAKGGFLRRFKEKDIPGTASRLAPDFCSVYVISKGKITSMRSASRAAPSFSSLRNQIMSQPSIKATDTKTSEPYILPTADTPTPTPTPTPTKPAERAQMEPIRNIANEMGTMRSPLTIGRGYMGKSYEKLPDTDISYVSTGRASVDRLFNSVSDNTEVVRSPGFSNSSGSDAFSSETSQIGRMSMEIHSPPEYSVIGQDEEISISSMDDMETEMRRLKQELRQTMDMYSTACKEALTAKQKARELQQWKVDEQRKLEEARMAEEAALAVAEREKAKSKAAIEAAEAAQRIAELEAQKRIKAEMKALKESEEKRKAIDALSQTDVRYRKYTIEEIESATDFFAEARKIGEGGYGPVYKCNLDHTPVAVKVLRPDAAQGRSQFQQEVEVLSCIRHPNMVLLLGACPEYGCLVYEYMGNGSLDDCLFRRGKKSPLSWQLRFKIAAEIATGLLFLHQTKPEPLVHRDLKPGNILLDRNYVSKISDVGLARLVPPTVADTVTQYRMTSTAGTFCYIDPEYQQTGMLGIKSDIYSLGIMLLQLITAKPPMGLTHHIDRAIENGTLADLLDPNVNDWPVEEALIFAKMALKCAELRRKDRPDLGKVVLPELNRLRALAEDEMSHGSGGCYSPQRQVSMRQDDYQQSEASSRGPSLIESSEVNY